MFVRFLRGDLPLYAPLDCEFVTSELMDDLVMWFSSGGTKSVWHYDDYENLNCLIRGDLSGYLSELLIIIYSQKLSQVVLKFYHSDFSSSKRFLELCPCSTADK